METFWRGYRPRWHDRKIDWDYYKWLNQAADVPLNVLEGRQLGNTSCPLVYEWHNRRYWGAAHGTTGILYILLSVYHEFIKSDQGWVQDIHKTISYLVDVFNKGATRLMALTAKEESENFPSRHNGSTELVQWCHGAPALVFLLARASLVWDDASYVRALEKAGSIIWRRGYERIFEY